VIFRRLALVLAAAAVLATSACVAVVALAFALYALLRAYLTAAGAAAVVAGAAALLLAITAILVSRQPRVGRRAARSTTTGSLVERAIALVQEKPAVAIAAALGAGFMIIRNPRYFGAAIRAFVEGRENPAGPL